MMTVVPLTLNELKLLKQVQNFYFPELLRYFGDESARSLVEGTQGDATLRSFMNWDAIKKDPETKKTLSHWRKQEFRKTILL
jgi:hypothetical protein